MKPNGQMTTEQPDVRSTDFDTMSPLEMLTLINRLDAEAAGAVSSVLPQIERAVKLIESRISSGGRLFYAGAGTSGRLGVLDAAECPPTFGVDENLVQGIIAGGEEAIRHAIEGAEDDCDAAGRDLAERSFCNRDTLVAISASGRTPYCLGALNYAWKTDAATISVCCNHDTPMAAASMIGIEIPTGHEVITGSTRLKAGTAQKMVLNMISTVVMTRLGKVYKNEMVVMQPTNTKLKERAVQIVMRATENFDREMVENTLSDAEMDIKAAIVMILTDSSKVQSKEALAQAHGFVRIAMDLLNGDSRQDERW